MSSDRTEETDRQAKMKVRNALASSLSSSSSESFRRLEDRIKKKQEQQGVVTSPNPPRHFVVCDNNAIGASPRSMSSSAPVTPIRNFDELMRDRQERESLTPSQATPSPSPSAATATSRQSLHSGPATPPPLDLEERIRIKQEKGTLTPSRTSSFVAESASGSEASTSSDALPDQLNNSPAQDPPTRLMSGSGSQAPGLADLEERICLKTERGSLAQLSTAMPSGRVAAGAPIRKSLPGRASPPTFPPLLEGEGDDEDSVSDDARIDSSLQRVAGASASSSLASTPADRYRAAREKRKSDSAATPSSPSPSTSSARSSSGPLLSAQIPGAVASCSTETLMKNDMIDGPEIDRMPDGPSMFDDFKPDVDNDGLSVTAKRKMAGDDADYKKKIDAGPHSTVGAISVNPHTDAGPLDIKEQLRNSKVTGGPEIDRCDNGPSASDDFKPDLDVSNDNDALKKKLDDDNRFLKQTNKEDLLSGDLGSMAPPNWSRTVGSQFNYDTQHEFLPYQPRIRRPEDQTEIGDGAISTVAETTASSAHQTSYGRIADPEVALGESEPDNAGLAVALPLPAEEEEEIRGILPTATEYDPDSKPPVYKKKRFRLVFFIAMIIVVFVAVGVTVGVTKRSSNKQSVVVNTDSPTPSPTMAPTSVVEQSLRVQLKEVSVGKESDFGDLNTVQGRAFNWLLINGSHTEYSKPEVQERYVAAMFYFSLSEDGDWNDCAPYGPKVSMKEGEDKVYCNFTDRFGNTTTYENASRWLSGTHHCEWGGLKCVSINQVKAIDVVSLTDQNLKGRLPTEIGNLTQLRSVTLGVNLMSGTIPSEIGNLAALEVLALQDNRLSGPLPTEFYLLTRLYSLTLTNNSFSGSVDSRLGQLSSLGDLSIDGNTFTGSIPSEIGTLSGLYYFVLKDNSFSGQLPSEIGYLKLDNAEFADNRFDGTLPSEIGSNVNLNRLTLNNNKLSGRLPESLYLLTNLEWFDATNNLLSGTLSRSISQLSILKNLYFQENRLTGTIPSELGQLTNLVALTLGDNDFTVMEDGVCQGLDNVDLTFYSDCTSDNGVKAEVVCSCCTDCCDSDGICTRRTR